MLSDVALKQTPLFKEHLSLNARMVGFGGWNMPVQYGGIIAEHEQTRRAATLFDICHMGEFSLKGNYKTSGLEKIVSFRLSDMPLKTCRYGLMLNGSGGIIDDLIVYRIAEEDWMIVVNASNIEKDAVHIQEHLTKQADFSDISSKTGKLDLQGPLSRDVLAELVPDIKKLEYYTFGFFYLLGEKTLISRTGYTGELGYEIYFPRQKIVKVWQKLLSDSRVKPAGLGARDCLRLEMGYSLYGQDLDETISPLEAGLSKFIDFEKDFLGKDALVKQKARGIPRRMIAFSSLGRKSPRHNHKIYSESNDGIGTVTSGSFSPALQKGIGLGLVSSHFTEKQGKIFFGDDKNKIEAELASRPFYKKGSLKN